ncbi:SH3 domain-containing protein [Acetitomaculum ruminis DSM 5522]|uniref:SH3 domain-containing protein n=1 Tax=Acetitomaculum ruminis DSM 5522 TaxID=1120918 RepID=A0A1I0XRQ6_9FIRM|nr:NlpC/P60 family protein [Acetitomaculum ruminis]SFB03701.1 SH3 domain-containing protein [Acetitomaculum ruminis DSM 5522]
MLNIKRIIGISTMACTMALTFTIGANATTAIPHALDHNDAQFLQTLIDNAKEEKIENEETEETQESETDAYGYKNLGIAIVDDTLNVREAADENSNILGTMSNGNACEIFSIDENGWANVTSGSITGYVKAEYLVTGEEAEEYANGFAKKYVLVKTDGLKLRTEASLDAEVKTVLAENSALLYVSEEGEWTKVQYDGAEYYLASEYVEEFLSLDTAVSKAEETTSVRTELVNFACQYIGNPYVWGGVSLTNGADCSGFVLSVFAQYGISLPHHAASQANCGREISANEAQAGDLFFYSSGGRIDHVAIYIGGGMVVQAHSEERGICITSAYYRTPTKVISLLG